MSLKCFLFLIFLNRQARRNIYKTSVARYTRYMQLTPTQANKKEERKQKATSLSLLQTLSIYKACHWHRMIVYVHPSLIKKKKKNHIEKDFRHTLHEFMYIPCISFGYFFKCGSLVFHSSCFRALFVSHKLQTL